jgi:hypothetical protein
MKKYITKKFIQQTWKKHPETWWQTLRIHMYKGRFLKFKSGKEILIEDARKQSYFEPELKINGKWIKASTIIKQPI